MSARRGLVLAAVLATACAGCKPGSPAPAPSATARALSAPTSAEAERAERERERLARVAERLDKLAREGMAFWKKHGPDREHGGFHGTLARDGAPREPTDKGLIQTARHLWTLSLWYERREATPAVKALADDLYRFLDGHFRDRDGEYFYKVKRDTGSLNLRGYYIGGVGRF